jgi:hypothetical protein
VQLVDSIKTGIASYGGKPTTWEQSQGVQSSPFGLLPTPVSNAARRALNWNETAGLTLVSDFSASTGTVVVYGPSVLLGVGPEAITLDEATALAMQAQGEPVPTIPAANAPQAAPNSVLEMRPVHRSLRDVPREKMSEFERDYPW